MRYEQRLIRAIKARGGYVSTAGSRNLLSRLAIDLGMIGKESEIEATLLALSEKGKVRIKRMAGDNTPIRSVSIKAEDPKPKPKRKQGQPPELILVAVVEDNKEEEVAVGDNTPEPLHVRLSNALVALQVNADPSGLVKANSLSKVLQDELGLTEHTARDLVKRLGSMGLKDTRNLGGGKHVHHVRMDVHEVTEAMVAQQRAKKPDVSVSTSVEPIADAVEAAEPTESDVVSELLAIIERLEVELAESAASLERGLEVVERLQAEKAELERVIARGDDLLLARDRLIAELREQLASKVAPTAKAAAVIERYRTKS